MEPPKYEEFFNPLLQSLHALGGSATIPELVERVIDAMNLPQEVVDVAHKGGRSTVVEYRLAWARTYLKSDDHSPSRRVGRSWHMVCRRCVEWLERGLPLQDPYVTNSPTDPTP